MSNQALVQNWAVSADPFYVTHKRSGYSLTQVSGLAPIQAVKAVFGEEIADALTNEGAVDGISKMTAVMFSIWCYLRLRQKPASNEAAIVLPITVGEQFIALAGRDEDPELPGASLLISLGQRVTVSGEAMSHARIKMSGLLGEGDKQKVALQKIASTYGLEVSVARYALQSVFIAQRTKIKVLVPSAVLPMLEAVAEVPQNLVAVSPNWIASFDFHANRNDVAAVIDWLTAAVNNPNLLRYRIEGDDIVATFDHEHEFRITPVDGVYEESRNRRFNNMLLINTLTGQKDASISGDDMILINSYGTFLYAMTVMGAKHFCAAVPTMSQLVKEITSGNVLPMNALDEVGAPDADRISYEKYVTVSRGNDFQLPFFFSKYADENGNTRLTVCSKEVGNFSAPPAKSKCDRAALLTFNLVRMPRGMFIDGRRSCIQVRHIPDAQRVSYVQEFIKQQAKTDDLAVAQEWARAQFNLDVNNVWEYLGQHLIIGLSSKLAKLIKRTAMDAALVGELVGGESRGFKRFGQTAASTNNWLVESIVSAHAIWPAGVAAYWGEDPTLLVDHTKTVSPNLKAAYPIEQAIEVDFPSTVELQANGWYKATPNKTYVVAKGDVVAQFPFTMNEEIHVFYINNDVDQAVLKSIEWRETLIAGNKSALTVKVTVTTHEHQIKCRNNVKAMMGKWVPDCVHNELNAPLQASAVWFKDTNKWLDLVMQLVDVAACTAIKNADPEGTAIISQLNGVIGVASTDLTWSPILAAISGYRPLIEWFEAKYGRAVWFRWPDPSGEWVEVLKRMYKSAEGWVAVSGDLFPGVVPAEASNVTVLVQAETAAVIDDKSNVLVFYHLDGSDWFVQRAWSYVGTPETGGVWQPVKGELSSVRSSVGTTPLMAGVARSIEQQDPAFAKELARDGKTGIHMAAVFYAMLNGKSIKSKGVALPVFDVPSEGASSLLQTDELRELVTNPLNQGKMLRILADQFRDCLFSFGAGDYRFTVYLPVVAKKDSNSNFSSSGSFGDLILQIFTQMILGTDVNSELFGNLISRAYGALKRLAGSDALAKAPAYGRTGVQAKVICVPGIPLNEVWVRQSSLSDSVYQTMARTYK